MFDAAEADWGRAPAAHAGRRPLSERQAEVMERLIAAAAEEAEERPYAEISVRTIAKRAGVAPATAYTYFSGKDHLLAEVLLQRAQGSPSLVDLTLTLPDRVADTARTMGFGTMGSAAVAVCTTALLGDGPDVKRVRSRLGAEITRRLAAALRGGVDPAVLNVLQVTYTGALLSAGMGHLAFDAVPPLMGEASALMTGTGTGSETPASCPRWPRWPTAPTTTAFTRIRTRPTLGCAPRRPSSTTRSSTSSPTRATPMCWRHSATSIATRTPTASASTRPSSGPTRTAPCRSSAWIHPGTPACAPSSARASRRAGWRPWRTTSARWPWPIWRRPWRRARSTSSPISPGCCRWT